MSRTNILGDTVLRHLDALTSKDGGTPLQFPGIHQQQPREAMALEETKLGPEKNHCKRP